MKPIYLKPNQSILKEVSKMSLERVFMDTIKEAHANKECILCGVKVNPETDLRDEGSKKEWNTVAICQKCQDELLKEFEEGIKC